MFERGADGVVALELALERKGSLCEGDDLPLKLRISISGILMLKSSFFLSSMVARTKGGGFLKSCASRMD